MTNAVESGTGPPTGPPSGLYLSCHPGVALDDGGQTRALLMRSRILSEVPGVCAKVLTFEGATDYPERREQLIERNQLVPAVELLNIYDHHRTNEWADLEPGDDPLADLTAHRRKELSLPDGTPWRVTYDLPRRGGTVYDYLRADGTTYLRIPGFDPLRPGRFPTHIQRVSPSGGWQHLPLSRWYQDWVLEVAGSQRTFIFTDARQFAPLLTPMDGPERFRIHVLHNAHVDPPRRWDSPMSVGNRGLLEVSDRLDALVLLTERQRADISTLRGESDNLFVTPNPVDLPEAPEDQARDPRLAVIVARLVAQKSLGDAISAFPLVLNRVPDARLEIYGDGPRRQELQDDIDRRGLGESVVLKGFDPNAKEALWRASAFLMTSKFEGYPLATLESLGRGCPVVGYDVKYGPREQITEGGDGFLVPEGDISRLADRVVELMRSPSLVDQMGRKGRSKAAAHGTGRFLRDWTRVLDAVLAQKPTRTRIESARLRVERLDVVPAGRPSPSGRRPTQSPVRPLDFGDDLDLTAVLELQGSGAPLAQASLELAAVWRTSGAVVALPLKHTVSGEAFRVSSRFPLADLLADPTADPMADPTADSAELRLRVVWLNSVWETRVHVPPGDRPAMTADLSAGDVLILHRRAREQGIDDPA